jgi:DNA/RNA-binding domain of Phe-tRNA-synthetase-like protein
MNDFAFIVSPAWASTYPNTFVGVLALENVANPSESPVLEARKVALESELREQFGSLSRAELRALPTLQAYEAHYRRFQKSYHVQLQLESVALKGKPIPRVAALVEAMFMAELQNQLITAGHDLVAIDPPVRLDVASGSETYTLYNGQDQSLKAGDMYIGDRQGVISSVVYGPDKRTRIAESTRAVLFTVYGVPGISHDAIDRHLADLAANVRLVSPEARVQTSLIIDGPFE